MKINRWFFILLKKSISQRKGRVFIATISVTLATAVIVSAVSISMGIREKLGNELKAYGANIVVVSTEGYLNEDYSEKVPKTVKGIEGCTGQLYGNALAKKMSIEIIGLEFERIKGSALGGWRLKGRWPDKGEALAGINIKNALNLTDGDLIMLESGDKKMSFRVSGFVERGGAEDNAFMLDIKEAQSLLGLEGKLSALLIRGKTDKLKEVVEQIKEQIPDSDVKTLKQVAYAEETILKKIQLLMALVTLVVLIASAVSVASTMGATVLERREEIGLMKAIGGTRKEISLFYMVEAAIIGVTGGVAGFILGFISAQAVSKGAFNSYISIPLYISAVSLLLGLGIAIIASHFPVREAMRYNPAMILRGE